MLKISLEGQIEELERTFEAAHQAYLQNTGARATAFQTLTTNDAAAARVIEQRMKKLVQMQVTLRVGEVVPCTSCRCMLNIAWKCSIKYSFGKNATPSKAITGANRAA